MPSKKNPNSSHSGPRMNASEIEKLAAQLAGNDDALEGRVEGRTKAQQAQMQEASKKKELEKQNQRIRQYLEMQQLNQQMALQAEATKYVNEAKKLKNTAWFHLGGNKYIRFAQFEGAKDEQNLAALRNLFAAELSEPYSVFTYEYFIFGWPDLTIFAFGAEADSTPAADVTGRLVGAIVSKVERERAHRPLSGYIAMLAVDKSFRGYKLGRRLVLETVDIMKQKKTEEIVLDTPTHNKRALELYTQLGFAKTKFLPRYYLDGSDAVRLKLWLVAPRFPPATPPSVAAAAAAAAAAPPPPPPPQPAAPAAE